MQADPKRYQRVLGKSIVDFAPELEGEEAISPYCTGEHPSTEGRACPFIGICSKRIASGKLSLDNILVGSTHNPSIAHLYNDATNSRIPADLFTGQHMRATFIGMTANCTDPSTKAFEVPPYAKDAAKDPDFGKRQPWQDESRGWGGDK